MDECRGIALVIAAFGFAVALAFGVLGATIGHYSVKEAQIKADAQVQSVQCAAQALKDVFGKKE